MALTDEMLADVKSVAMAMTSQIEWADFPHAKFGQIDDTKNPLWNDRSGRHAITQMAQDKEIQSALRAALRESFVMLDVIRDVVPEVSHVNVHAAGLVQSAFKVVIRLFRPEIADVCVTPMRTKFRGLDQVYTQSVMDLAVPVGACDAGGRPFRQAELN